MNSNSPIETADFAHDVDIVERALQARAELLRCRATKEEARKKGRLPVHPVPEYRGPRLRLFARSGEFPRAS